MSRRAALQMGAAVVAGTVLAPAVFGGAASRKVVVWSERTAPKEVYPNDINGAIAEGLKSLNGWEVVTANIDQPDQGVSEELLKKTDVLIWWGHKRHNEVKDALVDRIVQRVKEDGMGFIAVHSSHFAKPYKKLMGTPCSWSEYKVDGSSVKVVVKDPQHPIAKGVTDFDLPAVERYGEPFRVPTPEAVVLDGVYTRPDGSKESSRQGLVWKVGKGKVFYFQVGHETFADLFHKQVQLIFRNAVEWAAP
jgi:trehalose utilization protein